MEVRDEKSPEKPSKASWNCYPRHPQHLINLLQDVQAEYSYISPEHLTLICDHVGVPVTQAWSVATFYKSFSLEPRGEHEIKVCLGTTCHLKGGQRLVEACERDLGVARGQTTEDLRFTLDTVNCLGSCALAPVVMVDEDYLGRATIRTLKKRLEKSDNGRIEEEAMAKDQECCRTGEPAAQACSGARPGPAGGQGLPGARLPGPGGR